MSFLKSGYNDIYLKRKNIRYKKIQLPYKHWFQSQFDLKNKLILDFGCNIDSSFYGLVKSKHGDYRGYDLDEATVNWLKINKYYVDFWKTDIKFDHINASQVYEHLDIKGRYQFLKRCFNLLKKEGCLTIDFPFMENLNIVGFWRDLTHKPVSSLDDPVIIMNCGFSYKYVYLVGWPSINPLRFIVSYLLFGSWQTNVQIIAKKNNKR